MNRTVRIYANNNTRVLRLEESCTGEQNLFVDTDLNHPQLNGALVGRYLPGDNECRNGQTICDGEVISFTDNLIMTTPEMYLRKHPDN